MKDAYENGHDASTANHRFLGLLEAGFMLAAAAVVVVGALYVVPAASGALADPDAAGTDVRVERWVDRVSDSTDTSAMYFAGPINACGAAGCVLNVAWPTWEDAMREVDSVVGLAPQGCEASVPISRPQHPDAPFTATLALSCIALRQGT
ncbi:MAG: hypothetical protein ACI9OJ_002944 [Myxococcota bacterium]|jgi:hypothetical protein